jgi:protein TonB
LPSPKAEGEPTPDPASRLPQFSSLFDSLETPRQTPLIPEGIAALSSTNETAPGDPETARGPEVSSKKNTVAEFEARPLYRENPPPDYPRIARHRGYQGTVILEVLVDENGAVRKVKTARTSGHKVLDRAAEAAVESWRFAPGRRGDDPIQMWVKVPVRFELE